MSPANENGRDGLPPVQAGQEQHRHEKRTANGPGFVLPAALAPWADMQRWVAWRYVQVKGRKTKVPYSAAGKRASSTDPATWATLAEAAGVRPSDGIGLVLGDGLQGVDLDCCLVGGTIEPWAREIVDRLDSYAEVSPSGVGIKIFFCGPPGESGQVSFGEAVQLSDGQTKRRELAYHTGARYYTVTGEAWLDWPLRTITDADAAWLRDKIESLRQKKLEPASAAPAQARQPHQGRRDELHPDLRALIERGAPEGARSEQFFHVVRWLADDGRREHEIVALLEAHPDGIAAKYAGRLAAEVGRCLEGYTPKTRATLRVLPTAHREVPEWAPLAIPGTVVAPDIPATLLPGIAGEIAQAVTSSAQTPAPMAVMLTLSVLAAAVQRRYQVQPTANADYVEPLALWTLTASPAGTRKTAVQSVLTDPLHDWEEAERKRMAPEIAGRFALRQVADKRIEKLKADAAKTNDQGARRRIEAEIARERETMPEDLHAPVLVLGDVTPEAAQHRLVCNGGMLSVISDEAAVLRVMAGAYGDRSVIDVFLKGHAGSAVHVERQSRSAHLRRPVITMGLLLQPDVLKDIGTDAQMRGSGVLARFLYAFPQSTVGHRDVRRVSGIDTDVRRRYAALVAELLDASKKPGLVTLSFDAGAQEVYFRLAERVERDLSPSGRLHQVADWASKLPGAMARIAGVLALAVGGPDVEIVTEAEASAAARLAELLIEHAIVAFGHLGADEIESDARVLLKWIISTGCVSFSRADALKSVHRFRTVERLKAAIERLQDWNCIGAEELQRNVRARPTPWYRVHPEIAAGGFSGFP